MLFDGKPETVGDIDAQAARYRTTLAKKRERLVAPCGCRGREGAPR